MRYEEVKLENWKVRSRSVLYIDQTTGEVLPPQSPLPRSRSPARPHQPKFLKLACRQPC